MLRCLARRNLFTIVAALSCLTPAVAGTITIDDFSSPSPAAWPLINANDPNPATGSFTGPGILGGTRDVNLAVQGTSGPVSLAAAIGDGQFVFNSAGAPASQATLSYSALGGVDLVDGTNVGLLFSFAFIDPGTTSAFNFSIAADDAGGTASFAGPVSGTSVFVPFSAFSTTGSFAFNSVNDLSITFNVSNSQN